MKKLLFLMASGFVATGAFAQSATESVVKIRKDKGFAAEAPAKSHQQMRLEAMKAANKTTLGGTRWYEPWVAMDTYLGGDVLTATGHTFVYYMGYDSTYLQTYSTGPGPVNWIGFGQVFDLINPGGFNDVFSGQFPDLDGNAIGITNQDDYRVDSIYVRGAYMLGEDPSLPASYFEGQQDTMIFSLTPVSYGATTSYTSAQYPAVTNYRGVAANGNIAKVLNMPNVSMDTRGFTAGNSKTWKMPLDPANRTPKNANGSYPVSSITYEVPGGFNVPKGQAFALSVTFKPGEDKAVGRDSVRYYNYYMYTAARTSTTDDWAFYPYYDQKDLNMSQLMHYRGNGRFSNSLILELINDKDFGQEYIYSGAFVNCATCDILNNLSVTDINKNNVAAKVFPNPASSEVKVKFALTNAADVTVSLTNTVGQVVKAQSFKAATANTAVFSTTDLTNGVYIYTVEANGQRQSGRVSVQH